MKDSIPITQMAPVLALMKIDRWDLAQTVLALSLGDKDQAGIVLDILDESEGRIRLRDAIRFSCERKQA